MSYLLVVKNEHGSTFVSIRAFQRNDNFDDGWSMELATAASWLSLKTFRDLDHINEEYSRNEELKNKHYMCYVFDMSSPNVYERFTSGKYEPLRAVVRGHRIENHLS